MSETKFTPGPLTVVLDGTMTGVCAEIIQACVDPKTGEQWDRCLGETETAYVRKAAFYPKKDGDGTPFDSFDEAPEQYELTEDGEEAIANAHLWAAAPDLYEALRQCRTELHFCAQQLAAHGQPGHSEDSVSRALKVGEAALAKARGEQVTEPGQ